MNSKKITIHGSRGAVKYDVSRRIAILPDGNETTVQGLIRWGSGSGYGYIESESGAVLDSIDYVPLFVESHTWWNMPAVLADSTFITRARDMVVLTINRPFIWGNGAWKLAKGEESERMVIVGRGDRLVARARAQVPGMHWERVVSEDVIIDDNCNHVLLEDRTGFRHSIPSGSSVDDMKWAIRG